MGPWVPLAAGVWTTLALDPKAPDSVSPSGSDLSLSAIVEIGVEVTTSSGAHTYSAADLYADTIGVRPRSTSGAGGGGAGGAGSTSGAGGDGGAR
jgi:hypothetical protein